MCQNVLKSLQYEEELSPLPPWLAGNQINDTDY